MENGKITRKIYCWINNKKTETKMIEARKNMSKRREKKTKTEEKKNEK